MNARTNCKSDNNAVSGLLGIPRHGGVKKISRIFSFDRQI